MKQLNFPQTIFIDRSFGGKRLPTFLRTVGFQVVAHKECGWLNSDADDDFWIPEVTSRGWIILSSDKRISLDPVNVRSVVTSKAQVIVTSDNSILPEFWGSAFVVGRIRIRELLQANPGPVFIKISHCSGDHVKLTRVRITHPSQAKPEEDKPVIRRPDPPDFGYIKF